MPGKKPGFTCGYSFPDDLCDGTMTRSVSPTPGPLGLTTSWTVRDYLRRLGYLEDAWAQAIRYSSDAITRHVGEDFKTVISGILDGLLIAVAIVAISTATGGAIGGAAGSLAGGIGAVPGAVAGADFGLAVGNFVLAWLGVGFLAVYIGGHLGQVGERVKSGTLLAWDSRGSSTTIDMAAREIAEAVGIFFSLFIQAIILYLTKRVGGKTSGAILKEFRESLLFRRCKFFEPWLIKNYPRLRAKYVKLEWEVLNEGPPAIRPGQKGPVSSIPESIRIRVGSRVFEVIRNKDKPVIDPKTNLPRIDPRTGKPETIGPALKHLDENATPNEWAKLAKTDFPISALAAALDQAEAQLMFQPPNPRAKPLKLEHWELIIDTTNEVWRVFHAVYTSSPQW